MQRFKWLFSSVYLLVVYLFPSFCLHTLNIWCWGYFKNSLFKYLILCYKINHYWSETGIQEMKKRHFFMDYGYKYMNTWTRECLKVSDVWSNWSNAFIVWALKLLSCLLLTCAGCVLTEPINDHIDVLMYHVALGKARKSWMLLKWKQPVVAAWPRLIK